MRCDCGYDFETGLVSESFLSPRQQALNQARPLNARASGKAFAAAAVFVVILLGLARLSGPKGPIGAVRRAERPFLARQSHIDDPVAV